MAINPVTSSANSQVIRPQTQADQARQAELARQAKRPEPPTEAVKPQPVVNTQGQTTGGTINTTA